MVSRCLEMRLKSLREQIAKDSHTLQSCSVPCSLFWRSWELTPDQVKYSNGSRIWPVRKFLLCFLYRLLISFFLHLGVAGWVRLDLCLGGYSQLLDSVLWPGLGYLSLIFAFIAVSSFKGLTEPNCPTHLVCNLTLLTMPPFLHG